MKQFAKKLESLLEIGGVKKDIVFLAISGTALLASMLKPFSLPFDPAWIAILLCGIPIILEAVIGLVTAFDIKADVLVSLALIASVCVGEQFAAGEVAFIMQLGALLEDLTVAKAKAGIEKLARLTPQTARVISFGGRKNQERGSHDQETIIPSEEVWVGDILRVLPGETIPVDGVITAGETSVNQAVMTGESLPVDKKPGDEVSSGTVNQFGVFEMRATKVGKDSSIQRMIRLVRSADAGKAKIVGIADRWATWIVVIALTAALLTWLFTGEIIRAVTILVVFCPCSLVLATPTAIMAAIGNGTKHGFLVREGDALERLAMVKTIAFDKTGTLTRGTPSVVAVKSVDDAYTDDLLYAYAASAEQYSEHPLGKAITRCFRQKNAFDLFPAEQFHMLPGRGVTAGIKGKTYLAGNEELLSGHQISITENVRKETSGYAEKGSTVIYMADDSHLIGYIVLSDTVRKESRQMISDLEGLGITPVLLTGDQKHAAAAIAEQLKINEVHANCLPEDKLTWIRQYQRQDSPVCMVGDGINDAPALKTADVGIAMGCVGSDIAVDAADIALIDDEVKELPHLLALSHRMMTTIKFNLSFSMGLNFLAIIFAITGILEPVVGALVHNAGSVFVIINSALLLTWGQKAKTEASKNPGQPEPSGNQRQIA